MIDLDRPPPRTAAAGTPRRRRSARPALACAFIAVAALALGAAVPPEPGLIEVLTLGAETPASTGTSAAELSDSLLTPEVLYTASARVVTAWPLTADRTRWTRMVAPADDPLTLTMRGGVLVVAPDEASPATFLDAVTGGLLWRAGRAGDRVLTGDGVAVVVTPGADRPRVTPRPDEAAVTPGPDRLRVADLRTGRTLWARTGPHTPSILLAAGRLITIDSTGRATVYRLADGRRLGGAGLGGGELVWDSSDYDNFAAADVLGDRLYVRGNTGGKAFLAAYDTASLRRMWRVAVPAPGEPTPCGTLICVTGDDGLTVRDAADGRVRWAASAWSQAMPGAGGRLLVADADDTRAALVDAPTGRVVRALPGSVVRGDLELRADRDRPGRTWVIDLTSGSVLDPVDDVTAAGCRATGAYLACPTEEGATKVWRVRATSRRGIGGPP
jgi:putative pyrroloquinoline-quinone binding quinoprotein